MTTTESDLIAVGELVRLRGKRLTALDNDFAWRRDPELAGFYAAQPTIISYNDFAATYEAELSRTQNFRKVMAVEDENGLHIGNVMFYNIDLRRREAEIGITIGISRFRGRGYGSQAIGLLVEYIFSETTINRVYLHTLDWNLRAQRAFRRSGFRDCGRKRRGGYYFHIMEFKREWNSAG